MKTSYSSISRNTWHMVSFLFVLIFSATALMGQQSNSDKSQKSSAEDRAKQQTQFMKEELKLNAAQEAKAYAINLKYVKLNDEARKSPDKEKNRKVMQKNNESRRGELRKILTSEQIDLYLKKREENKTKQRVMRY